MKNCRDKHWSIRHKWILLLAALMVALAPGCGPGDPKEGGEEDELADGNGGQVERLVLPQLSPVELKLGSTMHVLATTSILGDIVAEVGGDAIELTILMQPGQDPHGYEPTARDLAAVAGADVIFVNGWDLEQSLVGDLENVAGAVPIVPVSAGVTPRVFAEGIDPHVWLDPNNVVNWVNNISTVLVALDPANEAHYLQNATVYIGQLEQLIAYATAQISAIPSEKRVMVSNHDSLGYFAEAYDFEIVGTIIPGVDTLAEPSAKGLSLLVDQMAAAGICTIYAETTANESLAQAMASELEQCPSVRIVTLYTGALGAPGSGADNYLGMMRANIDAIVAGHSDE